jgi:hypothetical protein
MFGAVQSSIEPSSRSWPDFWEAVFQFIIDVNPEYNLRFENKRRLILHADSVELRGLKSRP